jgi:hypothetical protein
MLQANEIPLLNYENNLQNRQLLVKLHPDLKQIEQKGHITATV